MSKCSLRGPTAKIHAYCHVTTADQVVPANVIDPHATTGLYGLPFSLIWDVATDLAKCVTAAWGVKDGIPTAADCHRVFDAANRLKRVMGAIGNMSATDGRPAAWPHFREGFANYIPPAAFMPDRAVIVSALLDMAGAAIDLSAAARHNDAAKSPLAVRGARTLLSGLTLLWKWHYGLWPNSPAAEERLRDCREVARERLLAMLAEWPKTPVGVAGEREVDPCGFQAVRPAVAA